MIKIPVSASRNYDVIMERGALAQAGTYIKEALHLKFSAHPEAAETSGASEVSKPFSSPRLSALSETAVHPKPSGRSRFAKLSKPSEDSANMDAANKDSTNKISASGTKLCIITDKTVDKLYGQEQQALWKSLAAAGFHIHKYIFPGGEKHKNMATIESILNYLADNQFTRSDILLALGGGITGDITGFAAASFLRGIRFVQAPTSLLAIVDSSVGGKTGVNLNAGKNLAGAFWQPSLVLFDPDVLSTLSCDFKLDGVAEAVKAGCIADKHILNIVQHYGKSCNGGNAKGVANGTATDSTTEISADSPRFADGNTAAGNTLADSNTTAIQTNSPLFTNSNAAADSGTATNRIEANTAPGDASAAARSNSTPPFSAMLDDNDFLTRLAARAIEVKRQIVEADERENNLRQLLNFGHTIAHAIEKCSNYQTSHGHAVAIGMVMISAAAEKFGLTKENCHDTILNILRRFQFPLDCPYTAEALTEAALQDKKRRGETITLVIPESLGHCTLQSIPTSELRKFVAYGLDSLINPKGITK